MRLKDLVLRKEVESDFRVVEELTREAFWNNHVPGCNEHYLLHIMRSVDSFIHDLDIVAEVNGRIVGNIVYTKAKIIGDNGMYHEVITFGPISVLPDFQGHGIGSILIEHTKQLAKELGYKAILIYGDPDYYKRFGFLPAESYDIATADNMYAVALQAAELLPGALSEISGCFNEDEVYEVDEESAIEFDKGFEAKEQLSDLPSQLRFMELVKIRKPRACE